MDSPEPPATIPLWSLTEDTLVEIGENGSLVVMTRWGEFGVEDAGVLAVESLRRMALGPVSLRNVTAGAQWLGEFAPGFVALRRVLRQLSGSVVHSLGLPDGKRPLLSVIPVGPGPVFRPEPVAADRAIRLSRFAVLRTGEGGMLLESPDAPFLVLLSRPWAVHIATAFAESCTIHDIVAGTGLAEQLVADAVRYLVAAGVVLLDGADADFAEDDDEDLRHWCHHELMFHARSRTRLACGRPESVRGPRASAPPVVKPVPGGRRFSLPQPDLAAVEDAPLTELLETDHVCPRFPDRPITVAQLGELLFRAARVRSVGPAHLPAQESHEASQRPYFSVACLYELELYLTIDRCQGLPQGIFHYDPLGHSVTLINDAPADLAAVLDMAMVAGAGHRRPAALVTVTARLERTSWALGGAAYSTALLHFGALQQTLYLTAKAMGMAAHAVPLDAGDRVDRALELTWPAEVALGECVLSA
ncbi:SagB-type dehydrogenase domain-containing protein [Amycolatopsis xylanica]|uniref:SagB-type dehydrogenase domain-containing protein n=1 Tax=Amycolatopsis xylanica TaxID=589385 RepID=A0A1H3D765_9PSEU|nr:SagB family peptide dehydrogenase [Amycolatopsis xylanica]SDX62140.1 SagB-type dehydrogenase domain-containing protein [Amycolatopsis xylanica]